ncbi:Bcr/CflA family efflux MFS transporter [Amnibacterium sp. CER49]|uniref:Bcr/CflA family efflux MFS transporter n=1 Tax=Amnibacterium sp. CER49 TaxID=3039161 RepID=UPI00244AACC8|nr:Bcr/CflA family efflux MFS transporter [Amnibacterium sp. CER49]MDH2443776.1 Bcr/CflA family efflux MFS transporter [Amnibacterium sp. CER49]
MSSKPARPRFPIRVRLIVVLGLVDALGPVSIDLYVPAFPELQRDFGLTDLGVQLTLASMTAGFALGQAVVGTWSDRVGRRRPLLLATGLYIAGAITCTTAPSIEALLVGRVAQGIGAAGGAVLVLAIVRDLTENDRFVTLLSRVVLITTTTPLLAPVTGALLLPLIGWRGLFVLLTLTGIGLLFAVATTVPETLVPSSRPPAYRLRAVLSDRQFGAATVIGACTYASVYTYVAASPLLLRTVLGLNPPQFAAVFLVATVALIGGVQAGAALVKRVGARPVLLAATSLALIVAIALVPAQRLGIDGVAPCLWAFAAACGACFPAAASTALENQADQAGTATSVYGFTTFAFAATVSPMPGLFGITGTPPLAIVLAATAGTALLVSALALRQAESKSPVES